MVLFMQWNILQIFIDTQVKISLHSIKQHGICGRSKMFRFPNYCILNLTPVRKYWPCLKLWTKSKCPPDEQSNGIFISGHQCTTITEPPDVIWTHVKNTCMHAHACRQVKFTSLVKIMVFLDMTLCDLISIYPTTWSHIIFIFTTVRTLHVTYFTGV
jgi:hypothetical protein